MGRSSLTPVKDNKEKQIEIRLLTNIKAFFQYKEIDVSDVIDAMKASKRKDDPKAYWQMYYLIFTAFFIDHGQNELLTNYFTNNLPQNILNFKHALDIVQSILQKSVITMEEVEVVQEDIVEDSYNPFDHETEEVA